ncbi:hypothetical protein ECANGB1_1166 [Enterospora canceri]|uniref:DNA replication factor RFC1 C-terminal domain-containing protein n=1 Tax=Enterospora canceri TaxID=1081671 RepID=A0A1Y1S7C7_9MICR|nr:hypothetical protein ECANGB1_1166 [Enterospora canceri]
MCAQVSDDISFGDLIDAQIHGVSQNYSLLPYFGLFACVLSTRVAVGGRIDFPQYLGKMSSSRVVGNLLHGISLDSDLCLSDTQKYIEIFVKEACRLLENGCATECVDYIDQNGITRETLMNLFKYYKCDLENVDKKDKAAFTKEWNSRHKETRNKPVKSVEEAEKDSFVEE